MSKERKRSPRVFYWPRHGYYSKNGFGEWQNTDKDTIRKLLIQAGFHSGEDKTYLCDASTKMLEFQAKNTVHYAGPLAGAKQGMVKSNSFRILVTSQPKLPQARAGGFATWEGLLEQQYGPEQLPYFLGWLKQAYERVQRGGGPMLPALLIAGERDRGKSLAQNHLITPMLGGRMAKPARYWMGITDFNEDLCGAEHLMMEDEICPMKAEKRQLLADALKNAVANENTSLHPKGDKAVTVSCVWAISISTNEQPQNLRVLPFFDPSFDDKLLALRVLARPDCCPAADDYAAFRKFSDRLRAELPAFAKFLQTYDVPAWARGTRSLIRCYRNPGLIELVSDGDDALKLVWLIESSGVLGPSNVWTGVADDLESELKKLKPDETARLLVGRHSCGYLLRSLKDRFPEGVKVAGTGHGTVTKWRLEGPICRGGPDGANKGT